MNITIQRSSIPEEERTPLVIQLLEIIRQQAEEIQQLKDEIARLKGHPGRPTMRPSRLEKPEGEAKEGRTETRCPGSAKRRKTEDLEIHEIRRIAPEALPERSSFKGYNEYIVQDLQILAHNICYRLEKWKAPDGSYLVGNYRSRSKTLILVRYWLVSSYDEKEEMLATGLQVSRYVQVGETGARHQERNGYCTHIGNAWFAWFESTESKSRINFLQLLRAGRADYVLSADAFAYREGQDLAQKVVDCTPGAGGARL